MHCTPDLRPWEINHLRKTETEKVVIIEKNKTKWRNRFSSYKNVEIGTFLQLYVLKNNNKEIAILH